MPWFPPHPALATTDHRPWPAPEGAWSVAMRWHDLLFAHWPLDPAALRPLVPAALELDLFEGRAWIGVVPFRMTGVRRRGTPALPGPGAFPELNVRTYVTLDGRPGVWFLSLDAASRLVVRAARWSFHLPYHDARMSCRSEGADVVYRSVRTHAGSPAAAFAARYRPVGEPVRAAAGSLEHWLTERYCLYSASADGRVFRGEIHHAPWPLEGAEAVIEGNTMASAAGLVVPGTEPHLLFARFLDVVAWAPVRAR